MYNKVIYELAKIIFDHEYYDNPHDLETDPDTALYLAKRLGIEEEVLSDATRLMEMRMQDDA